jgi:hypothetical protein
MVLFSPIPKFPVLPFDVDCFLPQSLYLSKDYKLSRCECVRTKVGQYKTSEAIQAILL